MPMSTNMMTTLPMPMWNLMTYLMSECVCPLVPTTQIHVAILVPLNAQILIVTQQRSTRVIVGGGDGQNSPLISPPPNSKGKVVPQEPPNGGWSVLNT